MVGIVSRSTPSDLLAEYAFQSQEFLAPAERVTKPCEFDLKLRFFGHGTLVEDFENQQVTVDYFDFGPAKDFLDLEDLGAREPVGEEYSLYVSLCDCLLDLFELAGTNRVSVMQALTMLDDYLENLVANVLGHTRYLFSVAGSLGDYAFYNEGFGQDVRPAFGYWVGVAV